MPRSRPARSWLVAGLTAFAASLAVAIAAGLVLFNPSGEATRTAFANAPAGEYAIAARPAGAEVHDVYAVPAGGGDPIFLASLHHVEGYRPVGVVSPSGAKLAVILADGGTPSNPSASLYTVDLESGAVSGLAAGLDPLQKPLWTSDESAVIVTNREATGEPASPVSIWSVPLSGNGPAELFDAGGVFGAYPLGFGPSGQLLFVVIDGEGSHVYRDRERVLTIAPGFTRDWSLSPDASRLAFIETETSAGVDYVPRVVALDVRGEGSLNQLAAGDRPALGSAWAPSGTPTYGYEAPGDGTGSAQVEGGFDVPLAYSAAGRLAVEHYDGASFDQPGSRSLQLVDGSERRSLEGFSTFLGWASR